MYSLRVGFGEHFVSFTGVFLIMYRIGHVLVLPIGLSVLPSCLNPLVDITNIAQRLNAYIPQGHILHVFSL